MNLGSWKNDLNLRMRNFLNTYLLICFMRVVFVQNQLFHFIVLQIVCLLPNYCIALSEVPICNIFDVAILAFVAIRSLEGISSSISACAESHQSRRIPCTEGILAFIPCLHFTHQSSVSTQRPTCNGNSSMTNEASYLSNTLQCSSLKFPWLYFSM